MSRIVKESVVEGLMKIAWIIGQVGEFISCLFIEHSQCSYPQNSDMMAVATSFTCAVHALTSHVEENEVAIEHI